jgi:hypothetical protein
MRIVIPIDVTLDPRRVHRELKRCPAVPVGIDNDAYPVRWRVTVTAGELSRDLVGLRVEGTDTDVNGRVRVHNPGLGLLGSRLSFIGVMLDKTGNHGCLLPGRVVETAIQTRALRGSADRTGQRGLGGRSRDPGGLLLGLGAMDAPKQTAKGDSG